MFKTKTAAAVLAAALSLLSLIYPAAVAQAQDAGPTPSDRACLVAAAWNEARGAPDTQVVAVMHVVVNRTHHPAYSHTVCGVVLEKGQFQMTKPFRAAVDSARRTGHFVVKGLRDQERVVLDRMNAIAVMVLDGDSVDPTKGATHFWSPALRKTMGYASGPSWARKLPLTLSLGPFRFHRLKT
jgi:spore germination cell wall hydrolase CwlJ-like protein